VSRNSILAVPGVPEVLSVHFNLQNAFNRLPLRASGHLKRQIRPSFPDAGRYRHAGCNRKHRNSKSAVNEVALAGIRPSAIPAKERLMARETILVVDDSPTDLRVVTSLLQSRGYMVITANDGEEAVEKANRERPRLMILDVILPKKNGFQVCRQLKTSPDTKNIKILMLTGKVQDSDRYWGLKQGADDYLSKPFEEEEFLKSIDQLI
jgi:twitching motility two-component system response regulator PilH